MIKNLTLLLFAYILVSCSTQKSGNSTSRNIKDSLTAEIHKTEENKIFNGFAVSVVNEKGTLYQQAFGFSDVSKNRRYTEKTIQNIGSVSKTFIGIALLKAQEQGKLHLDEPIEKYLPFAVINPAFPNDKITIRQLANHTSSITDNEYYSSKNYILKSNQDLKGLKLNFDDEQVFVPSDSLISMRSFFENVLTQNGKWFQQNAFTEYKPGSIYEYSNVGSALAAYILERATGKAFSEFTEEYILKPLKMNDSGWHFEDIKFSEFSRLYENPSTPLPYYHLITYPDGGLITSVDDLGKYLSEIIKGYNGKGTLLNPESYKEYFKPQLSAENFIKRNERNPYSESYNVGVFIGFGFTGYIGHTGGDPGTTSMMFFDPKTNLGRIMIFNTNFSDKKGNDTFFQIWNILEKYQDKL